MSYLKGDDDDPENVLTAKQRDLLDWYMDAYTLFRNYNTMTDTIQVMRKLGDRRGKPISASTARRYINDAMELFGNIYKIKTEVINHIVIETLLDARSMAQAMNNPMAMVQAAKELKAAGGTEDSAALNAELIERHEVNINIDQKAERALGMIYKTGTVDFGAMMDGLIEDVQHEEVKHGGE